MIAPSPPSGLSLAQIVAFDEDLGIGRRGKLAWHHASDLAYFRRMTLGRVLLMGRATFQSIGKPLPGRTSIVLTRQAPEAIDGVFFEQSYDAAYSRAIDLGAEELIVAGGGEIYASTRPHTDRIIATRIPGRHQCDVFLEALAPAFRCQISDEVGELKHEIWHRRS
jgi:dihydrofolate reductase